ncbi:MAG: peptidoglycan DD-metalloendopeptidase family protein [Nitriliruptoraceae bacterium]
MLDVARDRAHLLVRWSLAVLLVAATVPVVGVARAQTSAEQELSAARAALERIGAELQEAEREVTSRSEALADAEERLAAIEHIVNEVAAQVERQRVAVRDAQQRLAEVEEERSALEASFAARVAHRFKQGPDLAFEALLSAEAAEQVITRTELLERVVAGDQVDLERLAAAETVVAAQRAVVVAEQRQLEQQLAEQQVVLAEAEELRSSRELAAADARQRAQDLAGERDDLEDEEEQLAALVREQQEEARRAAEARRQEERRQEEQRQEEQRQEEARQAAAQQTSPSTPPAPSAPTVSSGGYAWPMCAPVTSEYGPRWGRIHRGIDLGAGTGTPIRSIQAGTVIFAGWQGGYGQITLIDHGDGMVSAYAHQSRFAVGQGTRVSRGQVIGYVGSTGNSTGPHLHLETRVGGSAVNPRQYLSGSPC